MVLVVVVRSLGSGSFRCFVWLGSTGSFMDSRPITEWSRTRSAWISRVLGLVVLVVGGTIGVLFVLVFHSFWDTQDGFFFGGGGFLGPFSPWSSLIWSVWFSGLAGSTEPKLRSSEGSKQQRSKILVYLLALWTPYRNAFSATLLPNGAGAVRNLYHPPFPRTDYSLDIDEHEHNSVDYRHGTMVKNARRNKE